MKILLFLLTILFAVWLWRRNRLNALNERKSKSAETHPAPTPPTSEPSPMQACTQCGVHMPAADMVQGQRGIYCSQVHCQAASDTRV
ncbi:PP0621 family protein [Limnohabitans sp. 103DPR2]|uniref:PP0621 family protein n=1 Tax=Limnohabitans sp. 103DPR2 TaxID=1678129 RepID=UPI0006DCEE7B|nr:PP0621 family protein [Limnohabitans sp. 103DPR2]